MFRRTWHRCGDVLREFTEGLPWAHLDIAGPARAERTYDEVTAGVQEGLLWAHLHAAGPARAART